MHDHLLDQNTNTTAAHVDACLTEWVVHLYRVKYLINTNTRTQIIIYNKSTISVAHDLGRREARRRALSHGESQEQDLGADRSVRVGGAQAQVHVYRIERVEVPYKPIFSAD